MTVAPPTLKFPYPPRSFVPVLGAVEVWHAPEKLRQGIYLWCFEIDGRFWVNYVGKTSAKAGFEGRLWQELKDWRAGLYLPPPVDLDEFLRGNRIHIAERTPAHFAKELKLLVPRCRLFMAPLIGDGDCLLWEGILVNRLRQHPTTLQFLANRDKHTGYRRGADIEALIECELPLVGLNTPVEATGREGP